MLQVLLLHKPLLLLVISLSVLCLSTVIAMTHVHTISQTATTTTTEPVSSLSAEALFPFLLCPVSSSESSSPCNKMNTMSACPCAPQCLPPLAAHSILTLPSNNTHQAILVPQPRLSPPSMPAVPKYPLHVFSHGWTQVDTIIATRQCRTHSVHVVSFETVLR